MKVNRNDVGSSRADVQSARELGWLPLVALLALAGLSVAILAWQVMTPVPFPRLGLRVDRLGASQALLVSAIGAVTYRFSMR